MSKTILFIVSFIVFLISLYIYLSTKLPQGIEPKGMESAIIIIALCTAIISLTSSVITLILKILEIKKAKD